MVQTVDRGWLQPLTYSGDVTHGVSITVSLCSHEREMNLIKSFIKAAGVYIYTTLVRLFVFCHLLFVFILEIIIQISPLFSSLQTPFRIHDFYFIICCYMPLSFSLCACKYVCIMYVCMHVNITCSVCMILISMFSGLTIWCQIISWCALPRGRLFLPRSALFSCLQLFVQDLHLLGFLPSTQPC